MKNFKEKIKDTLDIALPYIVLIICWFLIFMDQEKPAYFIALCAIVGLLLKSGYFLAEISADVEMNNLGFQSHAWQISHEISMIHKSIENQNELIREQNQFMRQQIELAKEQAEFFKWVKYNDEQNQEFYEKHVRYKNKQS